MWMPLAGTPGKDFLISSFTLLTWPFGRRGENCMAKCLNVFHLSFEGLKNYLMVSWRCFLLSKKLHAQKYSWNKIGASRIMNVFQCRLWSFVPLSKWWSQGASCITIITSEYGAQTGPAKLRHLTKLLFSLSFWCMLFNFNKNEFSFQWERTIIPFEVVLKAATGSFVNSVISCNGLN